MSTYIPTTEDVRRAYQEHCRDYDAVDGLATSPESYEAEFDQWLALDRAALERVREAATEVTNQGDNHGRTHYEGCWKHHLHCLAAKIIHETGESND